MAGQFDSATERQKLSMKSGENLGGAALRPDADSKRSDVERKCFRHGLQRLHDIGTPF